MVRLSRLIGDDAGAPPPIPADVEISGLTADSREVGPGYLFAAIPGSRYDGADFIDQAVVRGATAVLAPPGVAVPPRGVALVTDARPRRRLALMAARFYGAQPGVVVAVTGTNGKTSVVEFVRQIWRHCGRRAASLGTLGVRGAGRDRPLAHTTPEPVALHRVLAGLAREGVGYLAIEASSHGLDQCRLDGVRVRCAAFTNLSRDHLDYHQDADAYLAVKLSLFERVMEPGGTAVLNADAGMFPRAAAAAEARGHRILSYGREGRDIRLVDRSPGDDSQTIALDLFGRRHVVELPLVGDFQASNALCALGLALATGCDEEPALAALGRLAGAPGRLERVARHPLGGQIYVDYAHTPDALEHALRALRPHVRGRLVLVFGCGGDRDRGKRPVMGSIAARLADRVFVTDDNPRDEDPAAIRGEVLAACPEATEIADRAEAIGVAVSGLGPDDVLVIAGKGHEQGQIVGGRLRPFDDGEAARAAVTAVAKGEAS